MQTRGFIVRALKLAAIGVCLIPAGVWTASRWYTAFYAGSRIWIVAIYGELHVASWHKNPAEWNILPLSVPGWQFRWPRLDPHGAMGWFVRIPLWLPAIIPSVLAIAV